MLTFPDVPKGTIIFVKIMPVESLRIQSAFFLLIRGMIFVVESGLTAERLLFLLYFLWKLI